MRVDDALAALLVDPAAGLELRVPVRWESRPTTIRAHLSVHNSHGLPVVLGVQVLVYKPWKLTAFVMIYNQQIRRLDVNGSDYNLTGDREVWVERTHKHRFSEQHQDAVAYTPDDIPPVPKDNPTGDHYRGVFEAFCSEQNIKLAGEYRWVDPVLPTA